MLGNQKATRDEADHGTADGRQGNPSHVSVSNRTQIALPFKINLVPLGLKNDMLHNLPNEGKRFDSSFHMKTTLVVSHVVQMSALGNEH
jgi:hypothetical protein